MKFIELLVGVLIAFLCTVIGAFLYVRFGAGMNLFTQYSFLLDGGLGGKVVAIGSLLNIPVVYFLMNKQKFEIGKGVILGLILLVVISQLV